MDGKRCISISESGDENAIANKSKIHVRGELILFCLSTPKFMHFAYLSLQTFVYKNQYVFYSLTFRRKVCHFLGGDMGGGEDEAPKWWMIGSSSGDEAPKVLFLR